MLSDNEIENMKTDLEQISIAQNIDIEEVITKFNYAIDLVERTRGAASKSRTYILRRARAALDNIFNNEPKRGDSFIYEPFGCRGSPRDWNQGIFTSVKNDVLGYKIDELLREEKIMYIVEDGKRIPVSEIIKSVEVTKFISPEGEFHDDFVEGDKPFKYMTPTEGLKWVKGQDVIVRDNKTLNGKFINTNFSHPLKHRWQFSLVGIAWPKGEIDKRRLFDFPVKYNQADPSHKDFLLNKMDMFNSYQANFELNKNKTKNYKYVFNNTGPLSLLATEVDFGQDEEIDRFVEKTLYILQEDFGAEAKKDNDFIPPYVFLNEVKEYHEKACIIENGKVKKRESGWDWTKWQAYAVLSSFVSSFTPPEKIDGSIKYVLKDSGMKYGINAFADKWIKIQKFKLPGSCLMLIQTSRGLDRWDNASWSKVRDPENADVKISIKSIAPVFELNIPEIEEVDGV